MDILLNARAQMAMATAEPEYRSATSRVYYAAFHYVMSHPKCRDFERQNNGDDHKRLIAFLKNSADETLRKLGYRHLPRLRALRNKADYAIGASFSKGLANEAFERASEIIDIVLPMPTANQQAADAGIVDV